MYSYEDRIRVVELYIKLGKRVRPHPSAGLTSASAGDECRAAHFVKRPARNTGAEQ